PHVARLVHPLLPGAELLNFRVVGARGGERATTKIVGQIALQPLPDVLAEGFLRGREVEVHRRPCYLVPLTRLFIRSPCSAPTTISIISPLASPPERASARTTT